MLLWAILLQTVPLKPEEERATALPRILDIAQQECIDCGDSPERRFRLDVQPVAARDTKAVALKGYWRPCGTTGAPVCPSRGRKVLHADF